MCEVQSVSCALVRVRQRLTNFVRVIEPREGRFGRTVHDVARQTHLTAKQHTRKVRRETCRLLDVRTIRDEYNAGIEVPNLSSVHDVESEKLDQRTFYSLNLTIALRVVGDGRVFLMFSY